MENWNERGTNTLEQCVHPLHTIPTFTTCTFLEDPLMWDRTYKGFIENISLHELSLELRDDYCTIQETQLRYGALELSVVLHFPDGLQKVTLTGIITGYRRMRVKEKCSLHLGIRLDTLNEKNRRILNDYLSLGIGDTNLIWNLWDNLFVRA